MKKQNNLQQKSPRASDIVANVVSSTNKKKQQNDGSHSADKFIEKALPDSAFPKYPYKNRFSEKEFNSKHKFNSKLECFKQGKEEGLKQKIHSSNLTSDYQDGYSKGKAEARKEFLEIINKCKKFNSTINGDLIKIEELKRELEEKK